MANLLKCFRLKNLCLAALTLFFIGGSNVTFAADDTTEFRVKAAFIYNFARFVEWPEEKLGNDDAPLQICVYGRDPFGSILEDTIRGKKVGNHPLIVLRPTAISDLRDCQIVYMSSSESERFSFVLKELKGASSLSVNDHPEFIGKGGMIRFVIVNRKLRFEINPDAASRENLKISSKLLRVAKIVSDES